MLLRATLTCSADDWRFSSAVRTSASICARKIVEAFPALLEPRIGLQDVAVNAASLKDGDPQRSAHIENLRRGGRMRSSGPVIGAKGKRREITGDGGLAREFRRASVRHRGLVIGTRGVGAFQSVVDGYGVERLVGRFVRQLEFLPGSQPDHAGDGQFLNRRSCFLPGSIAAAGFAAPPWRAARRCRATCRHSLDPSLVHRAPARSRPALLPFRCGPRRRWPADRCTRPPAPPDRAHLCSCIPRISSFRWPRALR